MTAVAVLLWLAALGGLLLGASRLHARARARARLWSDAAPAAALPSDGPAERSPLARWLALAGFEDEAAPALFGGLAGLSLAAGVTLGWALHRSGLLEAGVAALEAIPGGLGNALTPVLSASWVGVALLVAAVPVLVVRAARRARVAEVEKDLPLTLDLLATLGEAGLGFEAALDRITSSAGERPLAEALRAYQRELLAGVPRVRALRGLARRLEVTAVSILVSALVQADQAGASLTETLRRQADDLRGRRRERALVLAEGLPVKLVFPLVICFLPGLFVVTLGPAFQQFFQIVDRAAARGRR